ncbi:MAG: DUF2130 domain-containing protein, partial [bacterium]|nr:DUF2130 domain-containing protein [bacterium]
SLEAKHKIDLEEVKRKAIEEASAKVGKDLESERERSKKLTNQIGELLGEVRELKNKDEDRENEMKKKLIEEEEKIKTEARRKAEDEHKLKDLEKDKKMHDILEANEELRKKLEQGSQQTQGETLELELESKLRSEFPADKILEVKKGQRGADVSQEVIDKLGRSCGTILWESKNAEWSNGWISKLKEDQRQAKADLAVLVSVKLPEGVESFSYKEGVWIVSWKHFIPLSWSLRYNLVSLHNERQSSEGKDEKMKILYQYLTGTEFKNRVEGIVDAFTNLQEELEKEKRYFNVKWARQEKEIRKVVDHTHGMYGDLQAVIGKSLPEIKSLELESGDIKNEEK